MKIAIKILNKPTYPWQLRVDEGKPQEFDTFDQLLQAILDLFGPGHTVVFDG